MRRVLVGTWAVAVVTACGTADTTSPNNDDGGTNRSGSSGGSASGLAFGSGASSSSGVASGSGSSSGSGSGSAPGSGSFSGSSSGSPQTSGSSSSSGVPSASGFASGSGASTSGSSSSGSPSSGASSGSGSGSSSGAPVACPDAGAGTPTCAAGKSYSVGLTYYQRTAANNCGVPWPGDGMYVALSDGLYANSASCGKCIQANGKTLLVVDSCPYATNVPCHQDHLDLSPTAYQAVHGSLNPGSVPNGSLTATFVPCPVNGNIEYSFTSTTQQYYLAMVVTNAKYGIQKVAYRANGGCAWTAMAARTAADPHWTINGTMVPNPIDLLVTDEYGHVLEDDGVHWTAGQNVPGHGQFPSCP